MKNFLALWCATLCCFVLLFAAQCLAFFYAPSFYIASLHQLHMPDFMVRAFWFRFSLVAAAYVVFSLGLAALNSLAFRLAGGELPGGARRFAAYFCLAMTQILLLYALCAWQFPSILGFLPCFANETLLRSYLQIAATSLGLFCLAALAGSVNRRRALAVLACAALLPALLHAPLLSESRLSLPAERSPAGPALDLLLLGFDALDGDSGNALLERQARGVPGRVFRQAFTPLPATHPAWNSILSGLYPERHGVRFFFDPPLAADTAEFSLPQRWKRELRGVTFFASDQPETSYFTAKDGFDSAAAPEFGWRMHLNAIFLNHFVFPALWLNNGIAERLFGYTFNSPAVFNYDLPRFFNFSFARFAALPGAARLMALHTCHLHSPIRLTRRELTALPHWLRLRPRDFSYWPWVKPGDPLQNTPATWNNPYYLRRPHTLKFLADLVEELRTRGYFAADRVAFLSDHGERFVPGYEIYGGIHGIDLQTREQSNVVLAVFDPQFSDFAVLDSPVSLVDLAPTLLGLAGASPRTGYDGRVLFDARGKFLAPPPRALRLESMGMIASAAWSGSFPQIPASELESELSYQPDGRIQTGAAYYRLIMERKEFLDVMQSPELLAGARPSPGNLGRLGFE
ncbi:MAG: hypothetical protein U1F66_06250 [bacterium]